MEENSNFDRELKKIKAEEKRQEALKWKKNEENKRKRVIADSIKEIDNIKKSKRIVFKDSDDESEENTSKDTTLKNGKNCMKLFDDDDDFDENPEDMIKNRHVGKKEAKLATLEAKYGNDERFHLDNRFLEDDDGSEQDDDDGEMIKYKEGKNDLIKPFNKYDPSNPAHVEWMEKYKLKNGFVEKTICNEEQKQKEEKIVVEGQYFKIDEALKNELLGGSSTFSFLSSIGRPEEKPIVVNKPQEQETSKKPASKNKKEQSKPVVKPKLNSIVIKKFFINSDTNEFRSMIANFRRTQKEANIINAFKKAQPQLNSYFQNVKKNTRRRLRDNDHGSMYNKNRK